jgi:hypothetical protein
MAGNLNRQAASKEVAETNVNSSSASGSGVVSTPSDGVQKRAKQASKALKTAPKTAKEWDDYEAEHVARTGPLGNHFRQVIERLEEEAVKEQEVKLHGIIVQILAYTCD